MDFFEFLKNYKTYFPDASPEQANEAFKQQGKPLCRNNWSTRNMIHSLWYLMITPAFLFASIILQFVESSAKKHQKRCIIKYIGEGDTQEDTNHKLQ
jgi:hypothetical protein